MFDKFGIIYAGRTHEMDPYKGAFAVDTKLRTIEEAIVGKDVLIGLSAGNIVTAAMLKAMAPQPHHLRARQPRSRDPLRRSPSPPAPTRSSPPGAAIIPTR